MPQYKQNKKRIDPRYHLNEGMGDTVESLIASFIPHLKQGLPKKSPEEIKAIAALAANMSMKQPKKWAALGANDMDRLETIIAVKRKPKVGPVADEAVNKIKVWLKTAAADKVGPFWGLKDYIKNMPAPEVLAQWAKLIKNRPVLFAAVQKHYAPKTVVSE